MITNEQLAKIDRLADKARLDMLDRRCAVEIMGWPLNKGAYIKRWDSEFALDGDGDFIWESDWQPTRNIAQAWEVLEKFDSRGCSIEICNLKNDEWNVEIIDRGNGDFYAHTATAALAIVLACLKAKGEEI